MDPVVIRRLQFETKQMHLRYLHFDGCQKVMNTAQAIKRVTNLYKIVQKVNMCMKQEQGPV